MPATENWTITNSTSASSQSPVWMKNIAAVADAPMPRKTASIFFFTGAKSATAPSKGATNARPAMATTVATAKRWVPMPAGSPAPATR